MLEINELNNTSVLISSLDKIYNLGRLNGKLKSIDLYILNIIFKLLNGCCLELTHVQRKNLMELYRHFYFNTEYICHINNIQGYIKPTMSYFTQAETSDCDEINSFPKIYYLQDDRLFDIFNTIQHEILTPHYFTNIPFDTYSNFEIGKTITYDKIGKICFVLTSVSDANYKIIDILNNDVTNAFDKIFLNSHNYTLLVSKNNYSYGDINFKIQKITI